MKDIILQQYDEKHELYTGCGERCKKILLEQLEETKISIHNIAIRTKTRKSLAEKIEIKGEKYTDLKDITDICGIRVVTYLESDVYEIARLIEKNFVVDKANSASTRKLNADQFGYKSLHYVVSLNEGKVNIADARKYSKLKIEIQIRSILQHAWAEIEHDLGYKGRMAIPEHFRRSFNRLAALLETADVEFDRLKKDLADYEIQIKKDIKNIPHSVSINQATLSYFINTNDVLEKARILIKHNVNCSFLPKHNLTPELERLSFFNIRTIGELQDFLNYHEQNYLKFVHLYTLGLELEEMHIAIPLFYFQHFLACTHKSESFLEEYFIYGSHIIVDGFSAEELINIYNKAQSIPF
jgi:ppGpp synthetase/RelA/SpoT-type nucleotidyltranferase